MNAQRKDKWMCNWKMLKWPPKKVNECLCGYGWMDEDPMVTQCMVGAVKRGHSATTTERRLQEQATKQTKTMLSHVSRLFIPFQVCSYSNFDDRLFLHPLQAHNIFCCFGVSFFLTAHFISCRNLVRCSQLTCLWMSVGVGLGLLGWFRCGARCG